jgi:hypothetical protein
MAAFSVMASAQGNVGAAPLLLVSAQGSREASAVTGTPALIKVGVLNPDAFGETVEPLRVASDSGSWTNLLRLEVTGPGGVLVNWKLESPTLPFEPTELVLTNNIGEVRWWLSPEESAQTVAGTYIVTAKLDSRSVIRADVWKGEVASVPVTVEIGAGPAGTEREVEEQQLARARYSFDRGNTADALAILEAFLNQYPTNLGGHTIKSAILTARGDAEAAQAAVNAALEVLVGNDAELPEPPRTLLALQAQLDARNNLSIQSILLEGATLTLIWTSEAGQSYQVQKSLDLDLWEPFGTPVTATNATAILRTNVSGGRSFFRIVR